MGRALNLRLSGTGAGNLYLKFCMTGQSVEVPIGVEYGERLADGHDSYQAVGQGSHRRPRPPANPKNIGGRLIVYEALDGHVLAAAQEPPQPIPVVIVTSSGQDLHHDHVGCVQWFISFEQAAHGLMGLTARRSQVLDPGRGVY
jgi:hypothetical protein